MDMKDVNGVKDMRDMNVVKDAKDVNGVKDMRDMKDTPSSSSISSTSEKRDKGSRMLVGICNRLLLDVLKLTGELFLSIFFQK